MTKHIFLSQLLKKRYAVFNEDGSLAELKVSRHTEWCREALLITLARSGV